MLANSRHNNAAKQYNAPGNPRKRNTNKLSFRANGHYPHMQPFNLRTPAPKATEE